MIEQPGKKKMLAGILVDRRHRRERAWGHEPFLAEHQHWGP